ncbi:MAG: DUF1800 domain-containing protein [Planctomycetota bacterium]
MNRQLSEIDPQTAWQPYRPSAENPWSTRLAAHLLRRAAFGGTITEISRAESAGPSETLDRLFDLEAAADFEKEMATAGRLVSSGADSRALSAWWLLRMVQTPVPLQEKMTLFWHGHFATGGDKVNDSRAMLRQNNLLRDHCLTEFQPLVREISCDVATLIYLDSEDNRKTRPNENYARELMELFCLGPGNYTEQDIKEIARCFTGWEVRRGRFNFNPYQHDEGTKAFLGASGDFDGNDAVGIVLEQPAAARFIARKLIRFFVFDDLEISDELAEPVAVRLRETSFNIGSALRMILESELFFSEHAIGHKIKSPVELAVGFLHFFNATTNMQQLSDRLAGLGQLPLYPPNVKGWDGGKTWINASTVLARANLINELANNATFADGSLSQWASSNGMSESDGVEMAEEFLLATPMPEETRRKISGELRSNDVQSARLIALVGALPEFQLN